MTFLEVFQTGFECDVLSLDAGDLLPRHRRLIGKLKMAVEMGNVRERTAATMTLLKLCESEVNIHVLQTRAYLSSAIAIRTHLLQINLVKVFVNQLRRKDSALLAAYALSTCSKYGEWNHLMEDSPSSESR